MRTLAQGRTQAALKQEQDSIAEATDDGSYTGSNLETLYDHAFPIVFRSVYSFTRDRELSLESTQEAFARLLFHWKRLADHPAHVGWLTRTALNYAKRNLRRRNLEARIPRPGEATRDANDSLALRLAIHRLPKRQREALLLFYFADLPIDAVATTLGISRGAAKTHLFRARAAVGRSMGGIDV